MITTNQLPLSTTFSFLSNKRTPTANIDYVDVTTFEGSRYEVYFDDTLTSGASQYIMYQFPPLSSGVLVALSNRSFKSLNGSAEITILWNTTGYTLGAPLTTFNTNRNSTRTSETQVNLITGVPTDEGLIRESDFLTSTGVGSNSSGSISPSLGLRVYSPESFFVAKVTNLHSQVNRIHLEYSFMEIASDQFNL